MQNQSLDEFDALAEELTLRREVDNNHNISYFNSDNQLHRVNGPALIYTNGAKYWYQYNLLHRLDGPAVEFNSGLSSYHIAGFRYSKDEFNKHQLVIAHKASNML